MQICSIGECMTEFNTNNNLNYKSSFAGDTANTAIYLSRLGAKVTGISPFQELRNAILFIKKFSAGEEVEFQGLKWQSEWSRRPLRVYLGGTGPRLCQLAGEIADGIMLTSNADPVLLKWQKEQVEKVLNKRGNLVTSPSLPTPCSW